MTNHDPSDRDELVAAYVDGEATDEQRSTVEADAELLARAAEMRRIAALVAVPVAQPPAAFKDDQIAAAVATSATATNVTSLTAHRDRRRLAKLASVAAVVLIVLAVPIVLLNTGSEEPEDFATPALDEGAEETASGDAVSAEAAPQAAQATEDPGAGAETGAAPPAATLDADEESEFEESAMDLADGSGGESGDDGAGTITAEEEPAERIAGATRLDVEEVPDLESLSTALLEELDKGIDDSAGADGSTGSSCVDEYATQPGSDGQVPELVVFGTATVDNELVEYATISTPDGLELVVFDESCGQSPPIPMD